MEELKMCPFCGKKAQIYMYRIYDYKIKYAVRCNTHNCNGHPLEPVWFDSKEEAIKAWNRRSKYV